MITRSYWVAIASREHVISAINGGFCQLSHGKQAPVQRLHQGDVILFYSPRESMRDGDPLQAFTALGEVIDEAAFQVEQTEDFHPYRRKVHYVRGESAEIRPLLSSLHFTQNGKHWGASFRRGTFKISEADFLIIAKAMGVLKTDIEDLSKLTAKPLVGRDCEAACGGNLYNQPVLYSHFQNRDSIGDAVAARGFHELGAALEKARQRVRKGNGIETVAKAYLRFAATSPALYEAMFTLSLNIPFGAASTAPELQFAFSQLTKLFPTKSARSDILAETLWASLHGIALLSFAKRLPAKRGNERVKTLVRLFSFGLPARY